MTHKRRRGPAWNRPSDAAPKHPARLNPMDARLASEREKPRPMIREGSQLIMRKSTSWVKKKPIHSNIVAPARPAHKRGFMDTVGEARPAVAWCGCASVARGERRKVTMRASATMIGEILPTMKMGGQPHCRG